MNQRCCMFIAFQLLSVCLVSCTANPEEAASTCDAAAGCGTNSAEKSSASTAAGSSESARSAERIDAGVVTSAQPAMQMRAPAAEPGCSAPSCGSDGAMKCVGGQVSRCSRVNGCNVWQLQQRCARGCAVDAPDCAAESSTSPTSDEDAGQSDDPGQLPTIEDAKLDTQPLAAVAGVYMTPAPDQPGMVISSDLGWTFVHRDKIWTLYGDSWPLDVPTSGDVPNDAIGHMSFTDFPTADKVESYVAAHPAPAGEPAWHAAAPPLSFLLREGSNRTFAPMLLEGDSQNVSGGNGFTPMTGFSNGRDDERTGAFSISNHYDLVECEAGSCSDGYVCDPGIGRDSADVWKRACIVGQRSSCMAGPGFCLDQGTTRYDSSTMGRADSVVVRLAVGVMNEAEPSRFRTRHWQTRRFFNVTSRTVSDFDPTRARGEGNDYRSAQGNALKSSGVFIWGRPQFGGVGGEGRDSQLYLAWVPMPTPDGERNFAWEPRYFAGVEADGTPRFVERDVDSKPLDLDAATSGDQPAEVNDLVNQMAITWLPSVQRFVMFYGGDMGAEFLTAVFSVDEDKVRHDPQGRMFVRFAKQPWGPWTAPRELLAGGDRSENVEPTGLYEPGGILAHNNCRGATCARYEPLFRFTPGNNNGVLYAPNFIDTWTVERPEQINLYWFVSTWNPYQVVLMRTQLALQQ